MIEAIIFSPFIIIFGMALYLLFANPINLVLCAVFGHQPPVYGQKGWWSPGEEYARIGTWRPIDGIGREHANIISDCPRCGKSFTLCRIHLPKKD